MIALLVAWFLPRRIGMMIHATLCPNCNKPEAVIRHGTNRGGTARCRCKNCQKTFTPEPNPRKTSQATIEAVERALAERLSYRAIARSYKVGTQTIKKVAKDAKKN